MKWAESRAVCPAKRRFVLDTESVDGRVRSPHGGVCSATGSEGSDGSRKAIAGVPRTTQRGTFIKLGRDFGAKSKFL